MFWFRLAPLTPDLTFVIWLQRLAPRNTPLFRRCFLTEQTDPIIRSLGPERGYVHMSSEFLTV